MKTLTASLSAALLLASAPATAQDNAAVLAQIEESLPGTLINDPTSLEWRTQGQRLRVSSVVNPAIRRVLTTEICWNTTLMENIMK